MYNLYNSKKALLIKIKELEEVKPYIISKTRKKTINKKIRELQKQIRYFYR